MLEEILEEGFTALSLRPDPRAVPRLRQYYELLEEYSRVMNLTAIHGEADCARLHFLDSAALLSLEELEGKSVVDVGTGAGFPGLVLKILCPSVRLTLVDSLDKRVQFLRTTCEALGLEDVVCLHLRAEEAPPSLRESFDIAVSRAVARLNVLSELCLPFVRPEGRFLAMKGPGAAEELREAERAVTLLGGAPGECISYAIPGTETAHCLVRITKKRPTPRSYPRRWAQIKKNPL